LSFLEMYFRVRQQTVVLQLVIISATALMNHQIGHWFAMIPLILAWVFFMLAVWSYQLTAKDIEIDQVENSARTDAQKRFQLFKIVLDWALVVLITLILILTATAQIIDAFSVSV